MDLVDDDELSVDEAHLVLGVHEDEPLRRGELLAPGEEAAGDVEGLLEDVRLDEALLADAAGADGLVVDADRGLGRGRDDGRVEALVLAQVCGQGTS